MQRYSCVVEGQVLVAGKQRATLIRTEAQANMRGRWIHGHIPSARSRLLVQDERQLLFSHDAAVPRLALRTQGQEGTRREDEAQVHASQGQDVAHSLQFLLCCKPFFTNFRQSSGPW